MACCIMIYGVDYIRSHMDNIREWQRMNPGIDFIITTVAEEEEKATIAEITAGFEVVYIEEPIVQWCKHKLHQFGLPIHFLSDVMRWFCLDAIKDRGEKVFLIEADVICLRRNWMMEYPPTEALTLFGTDRACALFCPYPRAMTSLMDLVTFYRNVYEYLIQENIFVGNFDHWMDDVEHLPEAYYAILAKPIDQRSTEGDVRHYLNGIAHGLMGIGQRAFFGIHVQDGVEDVMYRHLKQQEWMTKKRKRKTKRGGQNNVDKYGCKGKKSRKNGQNEKARTRCSKTNW